MNNMNISRVRLDLVNWAGWLLVLTTAPLVWTGTARAALLAHYSFDTNYDDVSGNGAGGTLVDVGTVGNSGITTNAGEWVFGNGALNLSADRDYVSVTSRTFSSGSPYSIAFWAKKSGGDTGDPSTWDMVIGQRDTTAFFIALGNGSSTPGLRWRGSDSTTARQADFTSVNDTNWHHHVITADTASNVTYYLDGSLVAVASNKLTGFTYDTIGEAYSNSRDFDFHGQIDEVWIFNEMLTPAAVSNLYTVAPASTNGTTNVTTNVTATVSRLHVILQGGQSNGDGRADPAGLPAALQSPQTNIDFFYHESGDVLTTLRPGTSATSQFGPEITCGHDYANYVATDPSTRVAIVKFAIGGTSLISGWKPGGDATTAGDGPNYVTFQQTVSNGMAALKALYTGAVVTIDGMTWMQGESDDTVASTYRTNLTAFIADVRMTIQTNLPFIIARLSSGQTYLSSNGLAVIRAAQASVAAADPWSGLVDTDSFPLNADALHFSASGQQMLGSAFAYQLLYLQGLTNRFTPAQMAAGLCKPTADADSDGVSNGDELLAGTDPTNATSVLKAKLSLAGPALFDVSYPTATGRHYSVETQPVISGTNWITLLPPETASGTNSTRAVTNSAAAGFIRIRATLP